MAAGGWKIFTAGDVLTADDTMDYLQQGVLVFDSSGARGSAIASPVEGQFSYLKDTDSTEYYDGAAWTQVAQGGLVHIVTESFSAVSSVSLDNCFSGDYDNYRVLVQATGSTASATPINIRLRASGSDSAVSYSDAIVYGNSGGGPSQEIAGLTQMPIGYIANATTSYSLGTAEIMGPFGSQATSFAILGAGFGTTTTAYMTGAGFHAVASSYDGLTVFPASGTMSGFMSVYGYKP